MRSPDKAFSPQRRTLGVAGYFLYLAILAFAISHHELWGDELHSWNIAKASGSFTDLLHNIRYEGHPPLWYSLLWILSSFSHTTVMMQALQFIIGGLLAFIIFFRSPFPLTARLLIPFGYYFLYEYGVLSRSYGLATLLSLCVIIAFPVKARWPRHTLYYLLLFLLANTLLVAAILAASIHLYVLLRMREAGENRKALINSGLLGCLVLLPGLYAIFPPADSELNMDFWLTRWDLQQLKSAVAIPLRSLMPVPAPWEHHFWNTHCLLQIEDPLRIARGAGYLSSVLLAMLGVYILKDEPKSRLLFALNLGATLAMGILIPLTNARYVGFVFIGFIVAAWLHAAHRDLTGRRKTAFYTLLLLQLAGSIVAVPKDIKYIFSNAFRVNELIDSVPPGEIVATDYFGLNSVAAFASQPFYCIETNKPEYFLVWNQNMSRIDARKNRYVTGANQLFHETGRNAFYLLSMNSPKHLSQTDTFLLKTINVSLVDKREGAIEKWSNLYLYRMSRKAE